MSSGKVSSSVESRKRDEVKGERKSVQIVEYDLEEILPPPKLEEDGEGLGDGFKESWDEKEQGRRIGENVAEKLWETAWAICSERFYFAHAAPIITYELRDTWLRIIESTYMDEYVTMDGPPGGDLFKADEPPPILMHDSPSTDLILGSRPSPITDDVGGGGEPHAPSGKKESKKKSAKAKSKGRFQRGVRRSKSWKKKKISRKQMKNKKGSKKKLKIQSSEFQLSKRIGTESLRTPNPSRSETDEETETEVQPARKCPSKGLPWEVVFKSSKEFSEDLSPKMSLDFTSFQSNSTSGENGSADLSSSGTKSLRSCKNTATYSILCPALVICKAKSETKNSEKTGEVKNVRKKVSAETRHGMKSVESEKVLDIFKIGSKSSVEKKEGSKLLVERNQKSSK